MQDSCNEHALFAGEGGSALAYWMTCVATFRMWMTGRLTTTLTVKLRVEPRHATSFCTFLQELLITASRDVLSVLF